MASVKKASAKVQKASKPSVKKAAKKTMAKAKTQEKVKKAMTTLEKKKGDSKAAKENLKAVKKNTMKNKTKVDTVLFNYTLDTDSSRYVAIKHRRTAKSGHKMTQKGDKYTDHAKVKISNKKGKK